MSPLNVPYRSCTTGTGIHSSATSVIQIQIIVIIGEQLITESNENYGSLLKIIIGKHAKFTFVHLIEVKMFTVKDLLQLS